MGNSQTIKQRQSVNLRKKTLADAREARDIQHMYIFIKNTRLLPKLNTYRYICFNLAENKSTNPIVFPWLAPLLKIGKRGRFCSQTDGLKSVSNFYCSIFLDTLYFLFIYSLENMHRVTSLCQVWY